MARHGRVGPWMRFAALLIAPFLRTMTRPRFRGTENVPARGGVILAANHLSHFDPLPFALLAWDAGRRPRFLAKDSLFRVRGLGVLLRGCGQIPVHRGSRDAAASLRSAVRALQRGEALLIYPEGTITRDPQLWPMVARTGVARLALETGAPVVPVAQWGSQDVLAPYAKQFRLLPRKTLHAVVGPPVDLSRWQGAEPTSEVLRQVTEAVMRDVTALLAGLRGEQPPASPYARPLVGPDRDVPGPADGRRSA